MNDILDKIRNIDYENIKDKIVSFLRYESINTNRNFVLGLSGGIDSSVVAALASLSNIDTLVLIMPYSKTTPRDDVNDAISVAERFNLNYKVIELDEMYEDILNNLPENRYAAGNLLARLRMCLLYYYANLNNSLVLGTSDRSELLIGYFTKYGDGAADLLPIANLYKLQVRELAKHLDIDAKIIKKKSSPRLWEDHTAEEELGLSYEEIDAILYCLFDERISINDLIKLFDKKKVDKILTLHRNANHKRSMPKICILQ
ncbi:MAG: NAD(+) synthetase [Candidatus Nitrosocaldaceae archaeon]|nr:MAG: NAD(+) synthetase [Candidatus Nitrosocaldaceae archaeon]